MREFNIEAADGLNISSAIFECENPKALVQIIHGSVEHKERYFNFASFLNKNGYAVILSDNRGHGASTNDYFTLGYMEGYKPIIDDLYRVSEYIKNMYPDKRLYLLGHSLGSVFARCYLENHDDAIAKLVLSGTVEYNKFTPLGIFLTRLVILFGGKRSYNTLLRKIIMNGDDISWVSYNKENLKNYREDPLCGYKYPNSSVLTVMEAVRELKQSDHYKCKNPDLPILSISGEDDPVTGGEKGIKETFRLLEKIGYHNFENIVYTDMEHEVLNETDYMKVYNDVLVFFEK